MEDRAEILLRIRNGDRKALARAITIVENEIEGSKEILLSLDGKKNIPVIGFTGPPGAGKSTLINAILRMLSGSGKKIAVLAIDPTSPFNFGSLLGDRLRLSEHFNDENIFIRSLATRGSLGGLSEKTMEVVDILKEAAFDMVFVETVGVGQSEVEIAGLADTTVVVFVPEGGDEIQAMKSGIMEIADIFVVNKSDREGADLFANNLLKAIHSHPAGEWTTPVIKASATSGLGVEELILQVENHRQSHAGTEKKAMMLNDKAYRLIQRNRMKDVSRAELQEAVKKAILAPEFNIYKFADSFSLTK